MEKIVVRPLIKRQRRRKTNKNKMTIEEKKAENRSLSLYPVLILQITHIIRQMCLVHHIMFP